MQISATYTPTATEVTRAVLAYLRWRLVIELIIPVLLTVCGTIQVLSGQRLSLGWAMLGMGLTAPLLLWMGAVRSFRRAGVIDQQWTVEITDRTIRTSMPDLTVERPWSAFRRVRETDTAWLLGLTPRAAVVIPKRALPQTQRHELSHFLGQRHRPTQQTR